MKIEFYKYHGTGNDFVILDNFNGEAPALTEKQIRFLCNRHFGIGADGLMLLNKKEGFDFEMVYYNSDGNPSSMCGNGGRCLVKFAYHQGIHKTNYHFIATDGKHEANINSQGLVSLKMKDVLYVDHHLNYAVVDTGSPHFVKFTENVENVDVVATGRDIRYSNTYKEKGINVNFVETVNDHTIFVRTYERGVEDETLSCGTGVTASALLSAHNDNGFNNVHVKTPGGNLTVEFDKLADDHFENIWLCGPAEMVFKGMIELNS